MQLALRNKAANVFAVAVLALISPFAMAAGEGAAIIAALNEWKVEVLLVIIAFAVILWAKRGGKLLHP